MGDFERDMFGELVDPRRGRTGRPRHFATEELRARVRALRTEGLTQGEIAAAINVTPPTLRLHYSAELGSQSQAWRRHAAEFSTEGE